MRGSGARLVTTAIVADSRFPFPQSLQKSGNSNREVHRLSRFRNHQTACSCLAHLRRRWPLVRILVRADSGFAREELMAWCEANGVHFLFGLAKKDRLIAEIKTELDQAAVQSRRTGKPARRFKDFRWTTRSSWSRRRRVVAKAEWTKDEANPRFVVTSLTRAECKARYLYEKVYCARGDMVG